MEQKQFKAESKKLLDMMIHSIYTHKEIFLRELISNASDAIDKLYYRALTENITGLSRDDFAVDLAVDKDARIITIRDNGCGMTKSELEENLGTIAKSGSLEFKKDASDDKAKTDIDVIGQFGVGFYSAFMFAAAKAAGVALQMVSPYRSINLQDRLFASLVSSNLKAGLSQEEAVKKANIQRTFTGTSEHNTGLGFDLSSGGDWTLTQAFDQTAQFKWLQQHAAEYGFILRYAANKVNVTGIMYEPWHYRYVGVENAKAIQAKGMCLEEYIAELDKNA